MLFYPQRSSAAETFFFFKGSPTEGKGARTAAAFRDTEKKEADRIVLTRSEARDYIAGSPELILQRDGCGRGFVCPICMSGKGEHGTGLEVLPDQRHFSCFGNGQCFKNKDIFDIVGLKYGLVSFPDKLTKAAALAGIEIVNDQGYTGRTTAREAFGGHPLEWNGTIRRDPPRPVPAESLPNTATNTVPQQEKPPKDYIKAFHFWHSCIDQTDYWKQRGFTRETMSRYKIGYNSEYIVEKGKDGQPVKWKALIIPVTAYAYAIRNTDPNAPHGDRHRKKGKAALYNPHKIKFAELTRALFVVEGELDALSVLQSGGDAIAIRSTDNLPALIEKMKQEQPPKPRFVIGLFDSDEAGKKAREAMAAGLFGTSFSFEGYDLKEMHDPNGFLMKDPDGFRKFIESINSTCERIYNE